MEEGALQLLVRAEKRVFGLYVGLTASGYDLARLHEGDPVWEVVQTIRAARWPAGAVRYFGQARRPGRGVNPYWPRAAMLLEACFCLGPGGRYRYNDELELLRIIAAFPVSPDVKDRSTVDWIRSFPQAYAEITEADLFPSLWSSYLEAMEPVLREFDEAAARALQAFVEVTGVTEDSLPELVLIPNPLQAPEVADFVRRDGTVHIVMARARMSSVVHELLHEVFGPALRSARAEVAQYRHLLKPVLPAMLRMQYAWGDDDESWFRVFEESLMRAAAIWIESAHVRHGARDEEVEAGWDARDGFVYVPALLRCLRKDWTGPHRAQRFISRCLEACEAQAISRGGDFGG